MAVNCSILSRNTIFVLVILLLSTTAVYAQNSRAVFPVTVAPANPNGALTPNATYAYNFVFSSSTSCASLLNISVNITTNARGIGAANLNISTLSTTPSYVCEYVNGTFRIAHPVFSTMFENQTKDSDILSFGYNHTTDLDARYDQRYLKNNTAGVVLNFSTEPYVGSSKVCTQANGLCSGSGDNISWNQSYANTLYASIALIGDNASWNQSYANILYGNLTLAQVNANMLNWSADKSSYYTKTQVDTLGNFSANGYAKTYVDTLGNATKLIGTCGIGQGVQNVTANGVQCFTPSGSTYTNGTGLLLVGAQFNISDSYLQNYNESSKIASLSNLSLSQITTNLGNWSADKSGYNTTSQLNALYAPISVTGDNRSWNQSYANSLYASISLVGDNVSFNQILTDGLYYLKSNPNSYINSSSAGYNKTSWDTAFGWGNHASAGYSTLTLSQINFSIGNWSAEKSLYATIVYVNNYVSSVGNWSADKSSLQNLTLAQIAGSIGNFSSDGYNKSYIDTLGNFSANNATLVRIGDANEILVACQNITGSASNLCTMTPDGTAGWLNGSLNTNTTLNVISSNDFYAYGGVESLNIQTYHCDFMMPWSATMCTPNYFGVAVTGTSALVAGTAINPGQVSISSTAAGATGYYYETAATTFLLNGSEEFRAGVNVSAETTGNTSWVRLGFLDTVSNADAVDGAYFEINSNATGIYAAGKTSSNSVRNITANVSLIPNQFYYYKVTVNPTATNVTYTIYNNTALVWNATLTGSTTIPTATGRETGSGIIGIRTTAGTIRVIATIDYLTTDIEVRRRPQI